MDKTTIEWADKATKRDRDRIDPELAKIEFTPLRHSARLLLLTTCRTCGAAFVMSGEDTGVHLHQHFLTHHPAERVANVLRAALWHLLSLRRRR